MSDKKQQQISLIATNVAGQTIAMANTLPALLRTIVRHYSDHEAITIHDDGERITWTFRGKPQPHQWPSRQKYPDGVDTAQATETALRLVVRHYQQQGLCYVYQVKELSL